MLFNIIATLVIGSTLYISYKDFRKDSSVLKNAYVKNKIDYLWALLMIVGIIIIFLTLLPIGLPKFMTWSWISMLGSGGTDAPSGNIIAAPFKSGSVLIIGGFWLLLSLALPYLAKSEEETFRSLVFGTKKRIIASIKFGLVHMIVGVPLIVALVLALVGYIFSIFYVKSFNKAVMIDPYTADKVAILASTSVHTKYNFLVITLGSLLAILVTVLN